MTFQSVLLLYAFFVSRMNEHVAISFPSKISEYSLDEIPVHISSVCG